MIGVFLRNQSVQLPNGNPVLEIHTTAITWSKTYLDFKGWKGISKFNLKWKFLLLFWLEAWRIAVTRLYWRSRLWRNLSLLFTWVVNWLIRYWTWTSKWRVSCFNSIKPAISIVVDRLQLQYWLIENQQSPVYVLNCHFSRHLDGN